MTTFDHEFAFELAICRWAERRWPPGEQRAGPVVVARQLGIRRRRWDTLVIECDRAGLRARAAFGPDPLDGDLLGVVRYAPDAWTWYRDALPEPDYPWRHVREAVHRAEDRDLIETRRGPGGRIELRRIRPYPDWIERIVAIENKPDLDASAARDLAPQLERDVALSLADEAWVATTATEEPVEPALYERLPVEAGILAFDGETATIVWHPSRLPVDSPGTRIVERARRGEHASAAARFEYVDPEWKRDKRLEIAERAYGRGWRAYAESMRTDCRHFQLHAAPHPWCGAYEQAPTPAQCSSSCPSFEPEPPAWRQRGWPLEGGPGRALVRLLERQRARNRPES